MSVSWTPFVRGKTEDLLEPLAAGEVILVPTDTVLGLAISTSAPSPDPLFVLKRRPRHKAIPWLISEHEDLVRYGSGSLEIARMLAKRFWPGALTLIVRASSRAPRPFVSEQGTVALRLPGGNELRRLIDTHGHPLAVSSANRSGEVVAQSASSIDPGLASKLHWLLDDPIRPSGVASSIVDCTANPPRLVRHGQDAATIAGLLHDCGARQ